MRAMRSRLLGRTRLLHSGSDDFARCGVRPGDRIYVLTLAQGVLYLGGRLQVARVIARADAIRRFGEAAIGPGAHQAVAVRGLAGAFLPDLPVPAALSAALRVLSAAGPRPLVYPDLWGQEATMGRGVRELSAESAERLDALYANAGEGAWLATLPPGF
jgi:hypothetical protein